MVLNGFLKRVFCSKNWLGKEFRSYFFSKNGSELNSEVFSLLKMVETEFRGFSFPKIVWNRISRFFLSENGSEQNSKNFSLPRNGLERNSEVFLFRETGGIPIELPSVPSCSVFRGIIFLSENGNTSVNDATELSWRGASTALLTHTQKKYFTDTAESWFSIANSTVTLNHDSAVF